MTALEFDETVLAGLREKLDGAVVDRLIVLFGENVRTRQAEAAKALEAGDLSAATLHFHSIRGSAQLVGARRLEEVAARGEEQARQGQHEAAADALGDVTEAFRRAVLALDATG